VVVCNRPFYSRDTHGDYSYIFIVILQAIAYEPNFFAHAGRLKPRLVKQNPTKAD
jgi:hypothetical protein